MTIISEVRRKFRQGNIVTRLIYINTGLFLVLSLVNALLLLIGVSDNSLWIEKCYLPWNTVTLGTQPWSVISYMFTHSSWWHLLLNMFFLYWFGKIFLISFTSNQLKSLYLLGGVVGALIYLAAFNFIPYFGRHDYPATLTGASASILAIAVAVTFRSPGFVSKLPFIGEVKIKYIVMALVVFDFTMISSDNAGGDFAHLGGALTGWLFVKALSSGKDITSWITKLFVLLSKLFTKVGGISVRRKPVIKAYYGDKTKDFEYNLKKKERSGEIDRILEKIRQSGYDSLSEQEKKKLLEASDR